MKIRGTRIYQRRCMLEIKISIGSQWENVYEIK